MTSLTTTTHTLQMRVFNKGEWRAWGPATAGMFLPARIEAENGTPAKAILLANEIQMINYGTTEGVEFRVYSVATTITAHTVERME